MKNFPYRTAASGWFQVAWDHEISPRDVRPMRYFGQDLVCFRTTSGEVRVLDAFCAHLGANLGVGGSVVGDDIVCPFHGWAWDGQGRNTNIPYSPRPVKVCIRHYPVRIHNGAIMVWWDPHEAAPSWEPPILPEFANNDYYSANPHGLRKWTNLAFPPQVVAENTVDPTHFRYVHRAPRSTVIDKFETKAEYAYVLHDYAYGKPGGQLTPEGSVDGQLEVEAWGLGIIAFRMKVYVDAVQMFCVTPIDEARSDIHFSVWLRKGDTTRGEPTANEQRVIDEQFRQVEMDFPIWENMRYTIRAPIVKEESPTYQNFRKWSRQFYLPTEGPDSVEAATT